MLTDCSSFVTDVDAATQIPEIALDRHHRASWQTGGYFVTEMPGTLVNYL